MLDANVSQPRGQLDASKGVEGGENELVLAGMHLLRCEIILTMRTGSLERMAMCVLFISFDAMLSQGDCGGLKKGVVNVWLPKHSSRDVRACG